MNFFSNILGGHKSKDTATTANNVQTGTQSGGDSRYRSILVTQVVTAKCNLAAAVSCRYSHTGLTERFLLGTH